MSEKVCALKIIAQPNPFHRERYGSETCKGRHRSCRFIRSSMTSNNYHYPTVEIPSTWASRSIYIRVTLVTILTTNRTERFVHPYPIETTEKNVVRDPIRNALYFPVSENDFQQGTKSFRISLSKLIQQNLKNKLPLRYFNREEKDIRKITDVRECIELYQLDKSQLAFSIAEMMDVTQGPIIYDTTTAFSDTLLSKKAKSSSKERTIECVPSYGDFQGNEPVIMFIPTLDRRKSCVISFCYPTIGLTQEVPINYVDVKTISFRTPTYPMKSISCQPVSAIIRAHQNGHEIARVPFLFRSIGLCLDCLSKTSSTQA